MGWHAVKINQAIKQAFNFLMSKLDSDDFLKDTKLDRNFGYFHADAHITRYLLHICHILIY